MAIVSSSSSGGSQVSARRGSTSVVTRQQVAGPPLTHPASRPSAAKPAAAPKPAAPAPRSQPNTARRAVSGRPRKPKGSAGRTGPRIRPVAVGSPDFRNYQGIILAEFTAAELLIALTPIAVKKNQPGLSPYVPRDMTKLIAVGVVYFLLELAAVTGRGAGRFGAWFGLLILLVVGLNEAANVTSDLDLLAGVKDKLTGSVTPDQAT